MSDKLYQVVRRGVKRYADNPRCKFMDETDFHLSDQGRATISSVIKLASRLPGFVYAEWADESCQRLRSDIREMLFAYETLAQAETALHAIWESREWYSCVQAGIAHGAQAGIDVWSIDWKFSIEAVARPQIIRESHWLRD